MGRSRSKLGQALDRDVYQVVRKLLEDEVVVQGKISVYSVYDAIQRSNSSLKRRPKVTLEDSIERVLSVLQEDEDVQNASNEDVAQIAEAMDIDTNAMNRSLVKSWSRKDSGMSTPVANGDNVKKRGGQLSEVDRPTKKSKPVASYAAPTHVSLADIGGMDAVIESFIHYLLLPLKRPERYLRRGQKIPRGLLLHGPPGCGKTMLCEAVAAELELPFLQIAAPSIVSGMSGESEKQLRQHFETAVQMAPCIMFIDEIDAITPKRESAQKGMEQRIVTQLLTCMDDLALEKTNGKPVIVLAATNRPDSLDSALRRAGRFDTEINIGIPNALVRESILRAQTRKTEVADDVNFTTLAKMTPGFVGADLESLIYRAGSASNARYLAALKKASMSTASESVDMTNDQIAPSQTVASFRQLNKMLDDHREPLEIEDDAITMEDFLTALPLVQPSAKREGFATIPDTTWSNIGALQNVRKQLQNAIVEPIRRPERYDRFNINVPTGVLLWGPPGCGKTLLAKAVANESKANFISVKGPELLNKYVGESERAVRQLFSRAKSSKPCVVFFDELDAVVPKRGDQLSEAAARVVMTLLTELDGISDRSEIYVIAATNRPEMIDDAMLRPGRLGKHLYVGLPGPDERVEIMTTLMQKMPVSDIAVLADFARGCDNFSGADLSSLVYEAAQRAVERDGERLELSDLQTAVQNIQPSAAESEKYDRFCQRSKDVLSTKEDAIAGKDALIEQLMRNLSKAEAQLRDLGGERALPAKP